MIPGLVRVGSGLDTNTAWEAAWASTAPDRGPQRDRGDWRGFTLAAESRREDDRVKLTGEARNMGKTDKNQAILQFDQRKSQTSGGDRTVAGVCGGADMPLGRNRN
ncbi:hypothetical protein NDU88_006753 [Pleurodeles waltl]|uniref:Uncharacterized protein n=1 Tax=Pleurodeles waltl TaxID=8319 RepID=A0AAV7MI96_PLEWA|nr:hypothetical protein NDU88_006753 [Pleurodeles waltl]